MLDMVIAFDTTGSMSAYINAVKTHVKESVPKLFSSNPDLRIGIVAFGDYCDMRGKDNFGKAYQVSDLTDDENKIIRFINEAWDTGGGDEDGVRLVNINTIKQLVFNGVKYVVE